MTPTPEAVTLSPTSEPAVAAAARALVRVPSRDATVRRRVREMVPELGYKPTRGDVFALARWAHLSEVWRRIAERLARDGEVNLDGTPNKLLAELYRLNGELRA